MKATSLSKATCQIHFQILLLSIQRMRWKFPAFQATSIKIDHMVPSFPAEVLQKIKDSISKPLSKIINLSFYSGVHLDSLKISKLYQYTKKVPD